MKDSLKGISLRSPRYHNKLRAIKWQLFFQELFAGEPVPSPCTYLRRPVISNIHRLTSEKDEEHGLSFEEETMLLPLLAERLRISLDDLGDIYVECKRHVRQLAEGTQSITEPSDASSSIISSENSDVRSSRTRPAPQRAVGERNVANVEMSHSEDMNMVHVPPRNNDVYPTSFDSAMSYVAQSQAPPPYSPSRHPVQQSQSFVNQSQSGAARMPLMSQRHYSGAYPGRQHVEGHLSLSESTYHMNFQSRLSPSQFGFAQSPAANPNPFSNQYSQHGR